MKNNVDFIEYVNENELMFARFILKKAGVGTWIRDNRNDLVKLDENMISLWGMEGKWNTNEWISFSQNMLPKIFGLSEPDLNKLQNVFSGKDPDDLFVIEHGITRDDGVIKNFEVRIEVHSRDDNGIPIAITGVNIDTTSLIQLKKQSDEIKSAHKNTKDSINYASLIQQAILPHQEILNTYTKDSFIFWQPKDTVGGDIYFIEELKSKNEILIMVIDCTGHGVPGAFVTMLVKAVETQIIARINEGALKPNPADILAYFNKSIKTMLKQEKRSTSNAGFDGAIIYYDKKTQVLKFAGAETPLFYVDNGEVKIIKGDRYSVGYKKCDINYEYKEHTLNVHEGMKFYVTTDGFLDQNGGEKGFPFGKKRFVNIIKQHHKKPMNKQKEILIEHIREYESQIPNNDRNDDITVIGFETALSRI